MQNNKNFGISDSLIETVKEAIKGNQKKLDVDGDGKLEKSDFEKLRARKEEAEVDEAQNNWAKARKANEKDSVGYLNYNAKKSYVDRKITPYKSDLRKDAEKAISDYRARGGRIRKEEVEIDEAQKPYVSSGEKGSWHVMNAAGKIHKTFTRQEGGIKAANAHLSKNYNKLSKVKEEVENVIEDKVAPVPPKMDIKYVAKRYGSFAHGGGSVQQSVDYKRHLKRLAKQHNTSTDDIHNQIKKMFEEASKCNSTNEGTMCEIHGNKACPTMAEAVYSVSWGVGLDTQVVAKDAGEALSKAKQNLLKKSPKLSDPKYSDTWKKRPSISKLRETTEEVSDAAKKILGDKAKEHGGKVPFTSTTYKDGKKVVTRGHNDEKGNRVVTSVKNEEVAEADDAVAKQIAAKKEQLKKQIQQKIAQKQMSVMQQKAQKKIQDIKASNDKDVDDNMKKKGKDEVEVNPELREAEDLPKKVIKKGHEIAKSLIKHKAKVDEPYAVGMAQAKKSAGIKN